MEEDPFNVIFTLKTEDILVIKWSWWVSSGKPVGVVTCPLYYTDLCRSQ